jgi:hypothetical protein
MSDPPKMSPPRLSLYSCRARKSPALAGRSLPRCLSRGAKSRVLPRSFPRKTVAAAPCHVTDVQESDGDGCRQRPCRRAFEARCRHRGSSGVTRRRTMGAAAGESVEARPLLSGTGTPPGGKGQTASTKERTMNKGKKNGDKKQPRRPDERSHERSGRKRPTGPVQPSKEERDRAKPTQGATR